MKKFLNRFIDKNLNYGRHIIQIFAKNIGKFENVLDIGAGKGMDLELFKKVNPKANFYAVEVYEPYVEILKSKGFKVIKNNIERDKLPFNNEAIDVVIANQILEHCKEIFWIFHEVTRVLKIGGYFIIGVPNLASFHNRLLLLFGKQPTCIQNVSAHVRGYTKEDIINFTNIWGGMN